MTLTRLLTIMLGAGLAAPVAAQSCGEWTIHDGPNYGDGVHHLLRGVKAFALSCPGAEVAAVDFDPETFAPRYRLVYRSIAPSLGLEMARRHGIAGNQLFTWRRLMAQGALTAAAEPVGRPPPTAADRGASSATVRPTSRHNAGR